MLTRYIDGAMRSARYEPMVDGSFYGEIAGFPGVYASAATLEEVRDELMEVLEEWLFVRISKGLPVPILAGCELRLQSVE